MIVVVLLYSLIWGGNDLIVLIHVLSQLCFHYIFHNDNEVYETI